MNKIILLVLSVGLLLAGCQEKMIQTCPKINTTLIIVDADLLSDNKGITTSNISIDVYKHATQQVPQLNFPTVGQKVRSDIVRSDMKGTFVVKQASNISYQVTYQENNKVKYESKALCANVQFSQDNTRFTAVEIRDNKCKDTVIYDSIANIVIKPELTFGGPVLWFTNEKLLISDDYSPDRSQKVLLMYDNTCKAFKPLSDTKVNPHASYPFAINADSEGKWLVISGNKARDYFAPIDTLWILNTEMANNPREIIISNLPCSNSCGVAVWGNNSLYIADENQASAWEIKLSDRVLYMKDGIISK